MPPRTAAHGVLAAFPVVAILVVLRAPSLVEPPQFTDEGTYADIGRALNHGAVLYRDVWDNKPPGVYWLAALIDRVHTSVVAFHVIATLVALLTTLAVWRIGRRVTTPARAWAATLAVAVVVSLPTLGGDVLNAESVGALAACAAVLLLLAPHRSWRAILAGVAVGCAVLFKATFVADAAVVVTLPLWLSTTDRMRPRHPLATSALVTAGLLAVLGAATAALAVGGSLRGMLDVLLHQDTAYLEWTGVGGVAGSLAPPAGTAAALQAVTVSRTLVVLLAGGLLTWRLARSGRSGAMVVCWWLTWDAAAAMLSARGLVQYAQQAAPAASLASAMLIGAALVSRQRLQGPAVLGAAATLGAWAACEAVLLLPSAESALVVRQPLGAFASSVVAPRQVSHYLGRGWEHLVGRLPATAYDSGFGDEPARVTAAVGFLDGHSRAGQSVFVWGVLPWVYALSDRSPAGRYVTLNAAYRVDPAAEPLLLGELRDRPPAVMVVLGDPPPGLLDLLTAEHYAPLAAAPAGERCWVRAAA